MTAALTDHREQGETPAPLLPVPGPVVEVARWRTEHLLSKIEPTITCWLWRGAVDDEGYGKYSGRGAHVVVYERLIGRVPDDLQLDHLCMNRICVNPGHLDIVTGAENQRRAKVLRGFTYGVKRGPRGSKTLTRSACFQGHEYTDGSFTVLVKAGRPTRVCRICERARDERRRSARRVDPTSSSASVRADVALPAPPRTRGRPVGKGRGVRNAHHESTGGRTCTTPTTRSRP